MKGEGREGEWCFFPHESHIPTQSFLFEKCLARGSALASLAARPRSPAPFTQTSHACYRFACSKLERRVDELLADSHNFCRLLAALRGNTLSPANAVPALVTGRWRPILARVTAVILGASVVQHFDAVCGQCTGLETRKRARPSGEGVHPARVRASVPVYREAEREVVVGRGREMH